MAFFYDILLLDSKNFYGGIKMSLENVKEKNIVIKTSEGTELSLKLGFNQLAQMEEDYGSIESAIEELNKAFNPNNKDTNVKRLSMIRRYLRYCLSKNYPELDSDEKVGDLIDFKNLRDIIPAIMDCFMASMPSISDEERQKIMAEMSSEEKNLGKK